VDRVRSYREERSAALIGWYHTHPDLGIFLSETDLERTHRVLFSEPFQIALVYDPVASKAGYFFWESTQMLDSSAAAWREFDILIAGEPHTPANDETPKVAELPDQQITALVPSMVPSEPLTPETLLRRSRLSAAESAEHYVVAPEAVAASDFSTAAFAVLRERTSAGTILAGLALLLVGMALGYLFFQ
jgi:hypothetical protein